MAQIAKVGRVYHSGYADILLPREELTCGGDCGDCEQAPCPFFGRGSRHAVADNALDANWDDMVEITPASPGAADKLYLAAYSLPVGAFALGCIIGRANGQSLGEILLTGLLLGLMTFVLAWMLSRKFRLRRRVEYRIRRIIKSN